MCYWQTFLPCYTVVLFLPQEVSWWMSPKKHWKFQSDSKHPLVFFDNFWLVTYFGGQICPIFLQAEQEFFAMTVRSLFDEKSSNQFYTNIFDKIFNLVVYFYSNYYQVRRGDDSLNGALVLDYQRWFFVRRSVITVVSKKEKMGTWVPQKIHGGNWWEPTFY